MSSGERIRAARCGGQPRSTSWSRACRSTRLTSRLWARSSGKPESSSRLARQPTTSTGAPASTPEANGMWGSRRLGGHALFAAWSPAVLTGDGTRGKNARLRWHQHACQRPTSRTPRRPPQAVARTAPTTPGGLHGHHRLTVHARRPGRADHRQRHGIHAISTSPARTRPGTSGVSDPARRVRRRAGRLRPGQVHQLARAVGPVPRTGTVQAAPDDSPTRPCTSSASSRWPPGIVVALHARLGAVVVAAWLAGIIVNLLLIPGYYDVAVRDLGLLLSAIALQRLASRYDPRPLSLAAAPRMSGEHRLRADRRRQPRRHPGRDARRPARPRHRTGPAGGDIGRRAQRCLPGRPRHHRGQAPARWRTCGGRPVGGMCSSPGRGAGSRRRSVSHPRCSPTSSCAALVERHLGFDLLENARMPVHVVACDLVTGVGVALTEGSSTDAVLASVGRAGSAAAGAARRANAGRRRGRRVRRAAARRGPGGR